MVDALRRASRWIARDGCIVDIHPTSVPSSIEIDGQPIGVVDGADAVARHTAADAAVQQAIDAGWLAAVSASTFDFYTYADSLVELQEYIEANWRNARVAVTGAPRDGRPRAHEHVRVTKLVLAPGRK
jgi:hypothetical protein